MSCIRQPVLQIFKYILQVSDLDTKLHISCILRKKGVSRSFMNCAGNIVALSGHDRRFQNSKANWHSEGRSRFFAQRIRIVKSIWNDGVFFSNLNQMNLIKLKRGFDEFLAERRQVLPWSFDSNTFTPCRTTRLLTYQLDVPEQNELHRFAWPRQFLGLCPVEKS